MSTVAAAKAIEVMRNEEEQMTPYTPEELADGWEFKILRSNSAAFGKPETFAQVCSEEAEAGWIMVEKFDNARIRFKRPAGAKVHDHRLDFDPYRTVYGISAGRMVSLMLLAVFGAIGLIMALVFFIKSQVG